MFRLMKVLIATVALATAAISDGAQNNASALQCIHNKFGSGFIAKVQWYDMESNPRKLVKEESITAGFTSCADSFYKTRNAAVIVVGAEAADAITKTGLFLAASVVGVVVGIVTAGAGAVVVGVGEGALAGLLSAGASAGGFVVGTGVEVGAELGMSPKTHIALAGVPGHYTEVNLIGTVWDARVEEGDRMDPADADTENLEFTAYVPFPVHRVAATPDLTIQNATANACAFACLAGGALPGCKGFNYYPNTGLRDWIVDNNGNPFNLKLPILPNTCELFTKSSLDASPPAVEVKGPNPGVMFFKSMK